MAPLAAALEMAFKMFDIYDAAAFIGVLRGAPELLADFLETDNCQALLAATAGNPKEDVGTPTQVQVFGEGYTGVLLVRGRSGSRHSSQYALMLLRIGRDRAPGM